MSESYHYKEVVTHSSYSLRKHESLSLLQLGRWGEDNSRGEKIIHGGGGGDTGKDPKLNHVFKSRFFEINLRAHLICQNGA